MSAMPWTRNRPGGGGARHAVVRGYSGHPWAGVTWPSRESRAMIVLVVVAPDPGRHAGRRDYRSSPKLSAGKPRPVSRSSRWESLPRFGCSTHITVVTAKLQRWRRTARHGQRHERAGVPSSIQKGLALISRLLSPRAGDRASPDRGLKSRKWSSLSGLSRGHVAMARCIRTQRRALEAGPRDARPGTCCGSGPPWRRRPWQVRSGPFSPLWTVSCAGLLARRRSRSSSWSAS